MTKILTSWLNFSIHFLHSVTSPTAYQIPTSKSFGLTSLNLVNLQNSAYISSQNNNFSTGNSSLVGSGNVVSSSFSGNSSIKRGSDAQLISNSTNNAIYRLARIINQTTKAPAPTPTTPGAGMTNLHHQINDDSARRLSWER